ncbi:MAG TPA: spore coat U domain-containing protein [Anaeromyxobacter sp.]
MKMLSRLALAAALAGLAAPALAAVATGTFNVTATVPATCKVTPGAADLAFAAYDPTAAGNGATGSTTVSFHCTKGTSYKITLSTGSNSAGAVGTTRAMTAAGDYLSYELYTDSGYANVWSSSAAAVAPNVVTGAGIPGVDSVTIYGAIPGGQYPTPSTSYTDTITLTVNY